MLRKNVFAVMLVMIMLVSILAACGGSAQPPAGEGSSVDAAGGTAADKTTLEPAKKTTVSWSTWGNAGELERYYSLNKAFMEKYPNITIDFQPIPNDGYDQKMLSLVASNSEPDIYYNETSFYDLAKEGKLEALDSYLAKDASIKAEDFYPNLIEWCKYDGKTYGLPCDSAPMSLYYNKDLFKKLSIPDPNDLEAQGQWDINAFKSACEKLVAEGYKGMVLNNWYAIALDWYGSSGWKIYSDDGKKSVVNSPEGKEIFKFMQDMVKKDIVTYKSSSSGSIDEAQLFMAGKSGFVEAGRWYVPVFKDITSFEFDICPIPKGLNGGRVIGVPSVPVVMSANAKDKEAAWTFFSYFEGIDGQTFRLKDMGNCIPSINLPGLDEATFLADKLPEHKDVWTKGRVEGIRQYPNDILYKKCTTLYTDAIDKILLGADIDSTLAKLQTDMDAELSRQ